MKRSLLIGGIAVLLLVGMVLGVTASRLRTRVPAASDLQASASSLFPGYYVLRNYTPEVKEGIHETPSEWLAILQALPDENLVGIRCTERLADEGDAFFIREPDTHRPTTQVTEPDLALLLTQAQKTVTAPRKILTARLCETDTGKTFLEYTEGLQTYVHPDEGKETQNYLFYGDKTAFTPGIPVIAQDIWPYPGCDAPYAITREGKLYYGCTVWNETGYTSRYAMVDLVSESVEALLSCTMTFAPTPARVCEQSTL